MRRIPGAADVDAALKQTASVLKESLKGIHNQAAQAMAKGRYEAAERFIARGKEIKAFLAELEGLRKRWRELKRGGSPNRAKGDATPLWKYYQPVLKSLERLGGEAVRVDLEGEVKRLMESELQTGDRDTLSRGEQRWQVMIRRARKHLVKEGWLERGTGRSWRLTPEGKRAADSKLTKVSVLSRRGSRPD